MLRSNYDLQLSRAMRCPSINSPRPGFYCLGDPDTVARQLREFYEAAGGFGTLLIVAGKDWATREKRAALDAVVHAGSGAEAAGPHAGARARHRGGVKGP